MRGPSPLPSGLYHSALAPSLSYVANTATDDDSQAARPPHQAAGLPRQCGLPNVKSRFPPVPSRDIR